MTEKVKTVPSKCKTADTDSAKNRRLPPRRALLNVRAVKSAVV